MFLFCLVFKGSNLAPNAVSCPYNSGSGGLGSLIIPDTENNNSGAFRDWEGKPMWTEEKVFLKNTSPLKPRLRGGREGVEADLSASDTEASFQSHLFLPSTPSLQSGLAKRRRRVLRQPDKISELRAWAKPDHTRTGEERDTGGRGLRRRSESKVRYWLGHILEERMSQSCLG